MEFKIVKRTRNAQYDYKNERLHIQGNCVKDMDGGVVKEINGSVYAVAGNGGNAEFISDFSGYLRGNEMKYSVSELTQQVSAYVWEAIGDIEAQLTNDEQTTEE